MKITKNANLKEVSTSSDSSEVDLTHPSLIKMQEKFNVVFSEDKNPRQEMPKMGEKMPEKHEKTSPTLVGDLSSGDDLEIDGKEKKITEENSSVKSDLQHSDASGSMSLELPAIDDLVLEEDKTTSRENKVNDEVEQHNQNSNNPPSATETKIKSQDQSINLDLDLGVQGGEEENSLAVTVEKKEDDLEANLLGEVSLSNFSLNDIGINPTEVMRDKKKNKSKTQEEDLFDSPNSFSYDDEDLEEKDKTEIINFNNDKKSVEDKSMFSSGSAGNEEFVRLQTTLRLLRSEREQILKEVNLLKTENKIFEQDKLGLKAEIDELKIEISILKKRYSDELSQLRYQARIAEEKKALLEEKVKSFQREFDRLNQKVRVDVNQVKQREKELEGKLELMSIDSSQQILSRDNKILELKRKIDALEFNMENISIQEQKAKDDKNKVDERLRRIVHTLRGSIKFLEDDQDLNQDFLDEIKKM